MSEHEDRESQERIDREDEATREAEAAREDQADREDEADSEDETKGARGRRGVQGGRGLRGKDSDSIEVLTDVLDALRNELVLLREDVQKERRGRRLSLIVIAVAFVLVTTVAAAGWVNYQTTSERDRDQTRSVQVESMRRDYDQKVAQHATCVRRDDLRTGVRTLFLNFYDQLQATQPAVPRTPEEQAVLDQFLIDARQDVAEQVPPISCATEAPSPRGDRP